MSNEETLQEYNERLEENNVSLANVLTTINNLPSSSGGGASNIYSTEEIVIGTWIDGKPLYRKVIAVEQSITNMFEIFLHYLKIETLIRINSFQTRNTETRYVYDQFYDSTGRKLTPQYMGNKILFWTGTDETYVATIWIEYTKTTD